LLSLYHHRKGYPVLLCLQLKFYHGTPFTLELIRNEHKKNQDAIQENALASMKKIPLVITVFITTEQMKDALDIDNVVVVDWKCFDRFLGILFPGLLVLHPVSLFISLMQRLTDYSISALSFIRGFPQC